MSENATQTQEQSFDLTLTLQEVNVIIAALNEAPFKIADPLLKKIVPQAQEQINALQQAQQQ